MLHQRKRAEEQQAKPHPKADTASKTTNSVIGTLVVYFIFGFLLEKGHVFVPTAIQDQFLFRDFRMLKMFLSAVMSSMLSMSLLSNSKVFNQMTVPFYKGHEERGAVAVGIGGALLGAGMALAGACPGTITVQVGAGVNVSIPVLVGGFVGGLLYQHLRPSLKRIYALGHYSTRTIDAYFNVSFSKAAVTMAAMLFVILVVLHAFIPSEVPFADMFMNNVLTMASWPPVIAGICIGLLQIPAVLFSNRPIGSSSNLVACVSGLNCVPLACDLIPNGSEISSMDFKKMSLFAAMISGGFMSSMMSGTFGTAKSLEEGHLLAKSPSAVLVQGFIGGMCLIVGARVAGGCTSGHGISGMGMLLLNSMIAVVAMFSAAILTANLLK